VQLPPEYRTLARRIARGDVGGAEGLLAAILMQAVRDYCSGNNEEAEAARWFLAGENGDFDAVAAALQLGPARPPIEFIEVGEVIQHD
jgi:hypothetical protein